MDRESKSPTVIPERQMQDFMAVVATQNEHVEIVAPQDVDLEKGDPVRVTEGIFAGIEGRYIRHKGHSKVAVAIRNVATALTAYIPLKYIAKID
jgi:putative LPS biosynthesis related transcriptional regulatory protein